MGVCISALIGPGRIGNKSEFVGIGGRGPWITGELADYIIDSSIIGDKSLLSHRIEFHHPWVSSITGLSIIFNFEDVVALFTRRNVYFIEKRTELILS